MARNTDSHDVTGGGGGNAASSERSPVLMFALVAGLVLGGGAGWKVVGPVLANRGGAVVVAERPSRRAEPRERAYFTLENLVVNPAGTRGMRYLVITVSVEVSSQRVADELTAREAEVRDALVRLLGRKTVEELADVERRESLRDEIYGLVENMLSRGDVVHVYLPLYVIQ